MPHIIPVASDCLGKIQYDAGSKRFYADKNRPAFLPHVDAVLPPNGLDRCHSYSFSAMQQCLISLLNRGLMSPSATIFHVSQFVNIFHTLGDAVSQQLLIIARGDFNLYYWYYRNFPSQATRTNFLLMLNTLLITLNSVTGNLRYPASANFGNSWNRSIGKCYDMERWFYVEDGYVYYDETGPLFGIHVREYMNNKPSLRPLPLPGDGFCIHSLHDRRLIRALAEFNESIGAPSCARVQFLSASDSHGPFLFSSSNCFPLPSDCDEFTCAFQVPVTQPDPVNPNMQHWVWQELYCG